MKELTVSEFLADFLWPQAGGNAEYHTGILTIISYSAVPLAHHLPPAKSGWHEVLQRITRKVADSCIKHFSLIPIFLRC